MVHVPSLCLCVCVLVCVLVCELVLVLVRGPSMSKSISGQHTSTIMQHEWHASVFMLVLALVP